MLDHLARGTERAIIYLRHMIHVFGRAVLEDLRPQMRAKQAIPVLKVALDLDNDHVRRLASQKSDESTTQARQ